jgi:methyl coenzyme M reductase subunit D
LKEKKILNKTAQNILKLGSSSEDGVILIVNLKEEVHIQSNGKKINIDISNGKTKAEYEEAMEQLLSEVLIKKNNPEGTSYQMTTEGYNRITQTVSDTQKEEKR